MTHEDHDRTEYALSLYEKAKARGIPNYMVGSLVHYVVYHRPVGSFLQKVLSNDLLGAFSHADNTNTLCMRSYANFIYNDLPSECHGSPAKVLSWTEDTRL